MSQLYDEPVLFHVEQEETQVEWEPTDPELAIALELNTLATFRSQFRRLKTIYKSFRAMYEARAVELEAFTGWAKVFRDRYLEQVSSLKIGTEFSSVPDGIKIITYFDKRYPQQLREIFDPPPVLYVRGDMSFDYRASVSIVGTRTNTDYGRWTTEMFAYQLASWGFAIISGGARGIDSIAHKAAIQAEGKTLAVLGCGIDVTFPGENKKLFQEVSEHGALISEFPLGIYPSKFNFPARNRIIAALGRGTIVVEAPEKSGALITADLALQNGRDIFAIPGRLTDGRSKGTNRLLHDGAFMALEPSDVALRFGLIVVEGNGEDTTDLAAELHGDEAIVYGLTGLEAMETDFIVREAGLPAPRVLSALLVLQTKGLIKELPGSRFVRPARSGVPPARIPACEIPPLE